MHINWSEERNLTMLTDYYEFTMSNGYFLNGMKDKVAVFDMFFRNIPDNASRCRTGFFWLPDGCLPVWSSWSTTWKTCALPHRTSNTSARRRCSTNSSWITLQTFVSHATFVQWKRELPSSRTSRLSP